MQDATCPPVTLPTRRLRRSAILALFVACLAMLAYTQAYVQGPGWHWLLIHAVTAILLAVLVCVFLVAVYARAVRRRSGKVSRITCLLILLLSAYLGWGTFKELMSVRVYVVWDPATGSVTAIMDEHAVVVRGPTHVEEGRTVLERREGLVFSERLCGAGGGSRSSGEQFELDGIGVGIVRLRIRGHCIVYSKHRSIAVDGKKYPMHRGNFLLPVRLIEVGRQEGAR